MIIWEYFVQGLEWRDGMEAYEALTQIGLYGFELVTVGPNGLGYFKRPRAEGQPPVDDLFVNLNVINDRQAERRKCLTRR